MDAVVSSILDGPSRLVPPFPTDQYIAFTVGNMIHNFLSRVATKRARGYHRTLAVERLESKLLLSGFDGADSAFTLDNLQVCHAVPVEGAEAEQVNSMSANEAFAVVDVDPPTLAAATSDYGAPAPAEQPVTFAILRSRPMGPTLAAAPASSTSDAPEVTHRQAIRETSEMESESVFIQGPVEMSDPIDQAVVIHLIRRRPQVIEPPTGSVDAPPLNSSQDTASDNSGDSRTLLPSDTADDEEPDSGQSGSDSGPDPASIPDGSTPFLRNVLSIAADPSDRPLDPAPDESGQPSTVSPDTGSAPSETPSFIQITRRLLLASQ